MALAEPPRADFDARAGASAGADADSTAIDAAESDRLVQGGRGRPRTTFDLAVAFRSAVDTDDWWSTLQAWYSGGEVMHVKILFKRPCGGKSCVYNDEYGKTAKHDGGAHVVSYYVINVKKDHHVRPAVDHKLSRSMGWTFLGVQASAKEVNAAESFLKSQVGKPYTDHRLICNFVCGGCLCSTGATSADVAPNNASAKRPEEFDGWICSELVTAALIRAGIIPVGELEPYRTAPMTLFTYLSAMTQLTRAERSVVPLSQEEVFPNT